MPLCIFSYSSCISHPTQLSSKSLPNSPPFFYLSPSSFIHPHLPHQVSWLSTSSTSLTAPFSPHPIPEASRYQGQCNPAICNLQLKAFNLSRLNTKKTAEQELEKLVPIAQQASWLLWEQGGGVRMMGNRGER